MNNSFILSIDQGTSSTKTIIFDAEGKAIARGSEPLQTFYKDNGFVEQDPEDIYRNVLTSVQKCLVRFQSKGFSTDNIKACGISNQRETFVVWDKAGKALYNAVVWQCKRSIEICKRWQNEGLQQTIQSKTGLLIDPYFSASKLVWLYENEEKVKQAIDAGGAYFGTIDTWLLYKLTNGQSYFTDYTNASRTLFFNLNDLDWDKDLLEKFGLANLHLPQPKTSAAPFGQTNFDSLLTTTIEITGMIGDSHAAAFGEGCFTPGTAKATLGTGCSIIMNTGSEPKASGKGMVTTVCWSTEDTVQYALEGVIVTCGATIEWLKNELGLFTETGQTSDIAESVTDNGGVYLIPAFSGLGAPYWEMDRRAVITGLTFGANKNHIIRAALESIAYQIKDVVMVMEEEAGIRLEQLAVNGGITSNSFVMRFLTDLLAKPVTHIGQPDVSALGAAYVAGLKAGVYKDIDHLKQLNSHKNIHLPADQNKATIYYKGWKEKLVSNKG